MTKPQQWWIAHGGYDPKGALDGRGGTCRCTECGEYFGSERAFEKHRTGPIENRRCLTAAGMRRVRLVANERGIWRQVGSYSRSRSGPPDLWEGLIDKIFPDERDEA